MKRAFTTGAALALLVLPAGATAKPSDTDRTNAAKECRAERGSSDATREAFRVKYGTNKSGKNAFGKCVSRRADDEEQEAGTAAKNASKQCKSEREMIGEEAFAAKYGTNKNGTNKNGKYAFPKNAFGKCVSSQAKAKKKKADADDAAEIEKRKSAAKECAAERKASGSEAFAQKYGTNANKRNAFGKCVSQKARV